MKVCLINPPNIFAKPLGYEWYPNIFTLPYLGMGYITSNAMKAGYDITHVDCPLQGLSEKDVYALLENNKFDVIGISNFYYNLLPVTKIVRYINRHCSNAFVFLGGFMPTLDFSTLLKMKMRIDCCIVGAGEQTTVELLHKLEQGEDWTSIEGIAYSLDGKIINNKRTTCLQDLDILPFPYRCSAPNQVRHVSILSSRGCYGDCTFCGEKEYALENHSPYIRYRSVSNVMEEISTLWDKYRFKYLRFNDSNFLDGSLKRKNWLKEFTQKLNEGKFNFKYSCNARANDIIMHKELLPDLHKSGLEAVFLGIESFNQRQLDLYSKRTTVQQNIEALDILRDCNIKVEIGLIMIEPFVTAEEFLENLESLERTAFFDIVDITQSLISSACTLISIPGTRMHNIIMEENVSTKENELGYAFVDSRMEGIYRTLKKWENETRPYANKRYLIYKAMEEENKELTQSLKCWYKELLWKDFLFMKELAFMSIAKEISEVHVELLIGKYRKQLPDINEGKEEI